MRCGKARTMINLSLDGGLPPEQTPNLDEHLARCSDCRAHRSDLETGRRMIRATSAEPSDSFEWKLQLKLNQALQEAAATSSPWESSQHRPWFGWFRTFGFSTAAGLALVLAITAWVLPGVRSPYTIGSGSMQVVDSAPAESAVTASAERTDRLSLKPAAPVFSFGQGGLTGRTVGGGTFLSGGDSWLESGPDGRRTFSALETEVARLRELLEASHLENARLMALLEHNGVQYLEQDGGLRQE